jgi:hypothetical protein
VIEECDVSERRKSIMVPERRNQKGWSKLNSELQIAIRFFQPFLLAPGNVVVKKKSFAKVLQSMMWSREDLFWPSTKPIARVPKWLSEGNASNIESQKKLP